MLETWVELPQRRVSVSDRGRVRAEKGFLLAPSSDSGNPRVRKYSVAALVLEAFVGPRPSRAHVAHCLDGDPENTALSNLEWATRAKVCLDTRNAGRNRNTVLTWSQAQEIHRLKALGMKPALIAQQIKLEVKHVRNVYRGDSWSNA